MGRRREEGGAPPISTRPGTSQGIFPDFPDVSPKQPSDGYFLRFTGQESEAARLSDPSRGT